jgi:prepilin-type N-terminal cleavage/methylation domain-containing protein
MKSERGFSLLETIIAVSLLAVVALGILPLGALAVAHTENQGHLDARVTEYAQDKMEQLLSLTFGDVISDTRVFPALNTGGTGLALGGWSDPAAPVDKYVDYLTVNGNLTSSGGVAAPSDWFYERAWRIENISASLKRITVTTVVRNQVGAIGRPPRATLVALKTTPF